MRVMVLQQSTVVASEQYALFFFGRYSWPAVRCQRSTLCQVKIAYIQSIFNIKANDEFVL